MAFSTPHSVKAIAKQAKELLEELPGVTKISLYGSIQSRKADSFSDIDLEVASSKPKETMNNLSATLRKIGDLYVILPISITKTERVYTIVWKNYSFYQKMDLKLLFSPSYSEKNKIIKYDEKNRFFHDFFIGIIRYTKYRKRQMEWTAYRFYKASIEIWLKLMHEDLTLDSFIEQDRSIKRMSTKWIYPKDYRSMDNNMAEIANNFLSNSINTKKIKPNSIEQEFGAKVIEFMRVELLS